MHSITNELHCWSLCEAVIFLLTRQYSIEISFYIPLLVYFHTNKGLVEYMFDINVEMHIANESA